MTEERWRRLIPVALVVAIGLAAIGPIRNYDLFWHLATGRWIVEHRALPLTDPFAIASDRHDWINGEWLFQTVAHGIERLSGLAGLSVVRGLLAAAVFALVYVFSRDALLTAIAFAGAMQTFDFRPSSAALLFAVLAIAARSWIAHGLVAMVWINVHPSALLAPGIAALSTRKIAPVLASAAALLVNPHGWRAIAAPLELMTFVGSGAFVNAEWLPSGVAQFPLLYVCVLGGAAAFVYRHEQWWRVLLFAGFAFLAIRHVRNQGLFFATFPLLVPLRFEDLRPALRRIATAAALILVTLVAALADHRLGVAPERFPIRATARLQQSGLAGTIYNPDQFGGLLIWTFYPERRVLTDGRNELYRTFIPEYARARGDQREWRALLRKYRIDLAVDEYRPPIPVINAATGARVEMPASLAYWPRNEWALIAFDEAAMVFARRGAFDAQTIRRWEIDGVLPDAHRR